MHHCTSWRRPLNQPNHTGLLSVLDPSDMGRPLPSTGRGAALQASTPRPARCFPTAASSVSRNSTGLAGQHQHSDFTGGTLEITGQPRKARPRTQVCHLPRPLRYSVVYRPPSPVTLGSHPDHGVPHLHQQHLKGMPQGDGVRKGIQGSALPCTREAPEQQASSSAGQGPDHW